MQKRNRKLLLEGRNIVLDAIAAGENIEGILISDAVKAEPKIQKIISLSKLHKIPFNIQHAKSLDDLSETKNHQGVIASIERLNVPPLKKILADNNNAFVLLFNKVDYEQNLGAVLRTAAACNVDAVVVNPHGVDHVTPTVARTSMGGALYVPVISQSLFQALTLLKENGYLIIGVDANEGEEIYQADLTGKIAFLLGGEESGITEPLKKYCDGFINIPMSEKVESLNMSVSAALVLYEKLRQEANK